MEGWSTVAGGQVVVKGGVVRLVDEDAEESSASSLELGGSGLR